MMTNGIVREFSRSGNIIDYLLRGGKGNYHGRRPHNQGHKDLYDTLINGTNLSTSGQVSRRTALSMADMLDFSAIASFTLP